MGATITVDEFISIYLYLDKIPNHAIIHEAERYSKKTWWLSHRNIVNGVLRTVMRTELPSFEDIDDTKKNCNSI